MEIIIVGNLAKSREMINCGNFPYRQPDFLLPLQTGYSLRKKQIVTFPVGIYCTENTNFHSNKHFG